MIGSVFAPPPGTHVVRLRGTHGEKILFFLRCHIFCDVLSNIAKMEHSVPRNALSQVCHHTSSTVSQDAHASPAAPSGAGIPVPLCAAALTQSRCLMGCITPVPLSHGLHHASAAALSGIGSNAAVSRNEPLRSFSTEILQSTAKNTSVDWTDKGMWTLVHH